MAGLKELLSKDYFGLPGWAYAVIVGGVGAALVFGPKLFGSQGTQTSTDAGTTQANTGSTSGYTPVGPFAGGSVTPVNDGQQSQSSADFAALQAQLQAIQNSLKPGTTVALSNPPSPQQVPSGTVHMSTTSQPRLSVTQQQAAAQAEASRIASGFNPAQTVQRNVLGLLGR